MGRGATWCPEELGDLASSWMAASEDPVVGIDQTAARLKHTLHREFLSRSPKDKDGNRIYETRSEKSCKVKVGEVFADVQKFRRCLRTVNISEPTGVTLDQILSMAIAIHVGKLSKMSYDFKDLSHDTWMNHLAYKVLRIHPKFQDAPHGFSPQSTTSYELHNTQPEDGSNEQNESPQPENSESADVSGQNNINDTMLSTDDSVTNARGGNIGRKAAKFDRDVQLLAQRNAKTGESIAESMKRKADLMEEKHALRVMSLAPCETDEDKKERDDYFRAMRRKYCRRAQQDVVEETISMEEE